MQTQKAVSCLRPVPNGTGVLAACDGSRLVSKAKEVFAYIDPDFVRWGADGPAPATPETPFQTDLLAEDADFATMFSGSGFFTPDQLIELAGKHREVLSRTGANVVPIEVIPDGVELTPDADRTQYRFVAFVSVYGRRDLEVDVVHFSCDYVRDAGYGYRVVRPQTT